MSSIEVSDTYETRQRWRASCEQALNELIAQAMSAGPGASKEDMRHAALSAHVGALVASALTFSSQIEALEAEVRRLKGAA